MQQQFACRTTTTLIRVKFQLTIKLKKKISEKDVSLKKFITSRTFTPQIKE